MNQITIECKNITKNFTEGSTTVEILKKVDLTASAGQLIMLMGPSGSGKTTLLSIIGGILAQDSGECLVLGQPINSLSQAEQTKFRGKNIGFMFQSFMLVPTLNALENASIPLLLQGTDAKVATQKTRELLEKLGLKEQQLRYPAQLSGGEQQRVAIARACVHKPPIILCDEPTSFLDHERGKQIMELLKEIKQENNCTIVVVTHDPRIIEFADHIYEIMDGTIENNK